MRKFFVAAAAAALLPASLADAATDAGSTAWTFGTYQQSMEASGRKVNISAKTFKGLQDNRQQALKIIEKYLKQRFGKADPRVMKAFAEVPREYYHYNYQTKKSFAATAYELENIKPWAVGFGSALSDYLGQAYMTQIAKPKPTDVVLEIGTGSGYQVSILSRIVKQAYSIEIIKPLGEGVSRIFKPLGRRRLLRLAGSEGRLRHHHRHLRRPVRAAGAARTTQARWPSGDPDRPAVQARRAVPVCLHQGT